MYVMLIVFCPFLLFLLTIVLSVLLLLTIVLSVLLLLAIVLSVLLRYTHSDCPFGIFKLFLNGLLTIASAILFHDFNIN